MADETTEAITDGDIGVIVWPYGAGHKQVGLCFGDARDPAAIFTLREEWAFQLRNAIFGERLKAALATLTAERDRLREEVERQKILVINQWTFKEKYEAERDALAARLAQAERVVEAVPALFAVWRAALDQTCVEPTEEQIAAGYVELVDRESSWRMDAALEAAEPYEKTLFAYVDALDGTARPGEEGSDG